MMEKGWYGPIALGVLATCVGLLYMARFIHAIFLRAPAKTGWKVSEAPLPILTSQALLVLGILVMTFAPKLLIAPISAAVDPVFASTLVWEGMSLELIYGYWNPWPTMIAAVAMSMLLIGLLLLVQRWAIGRQTSGAMVAAGNFYGFYRPLFVALTPPLARTLWSAIAGGASALAGGMGRIYLGNGQTYTLYVFYYFLVLYAACASFFF